MTSLKERNKKMMSRFLEWIFYLFGYTIVFVLVTKLFDTVIIDNHHSYLYSILIVLILSILNKTIKPILVTLTIPITGLTLGIFYPFINLFLLKLVDWILGHHFDLLNIWIALFLAIILSIINILMENIIIKPIIKGVRKYGQSSN